MTPAALTRLEMSTQKVTRHAYAAGDAVSLLSSHSPKSFARPRPREREFCLLMDRCADHGFAQTLPGHGAMAACEQDAACARGLGWAHDSGHPDCVWEEETLVKEAEARGRRDLARDYISSLPRVSVYKFSKRLHRDGGRSTYGILCKTRISLQSSAD